MVDEPFAGLAEEFFSTMLDSNASELGLGRAIARYLELVFVRFFYPVNFGKKIIRSCFKFFGLKISVSA